MHTISLRSAVVSPALHLKTRYSVGTQEYLVTGVKSVDWQPVWEDMPESLEPWWVLDDALGEAGIKVDDERRDKLRTDFDAFRAKSGFNASWNAALDKFGGAAREWASRHEGEEEGALSLYVDELDGWYSDTVRALETALQVAALEFVETLPK